MTPNPDFVSQNPRPAGTALQLTEIEWLLYGQTVGLGANEPQET
jgi:hypothetical protein